MTTRTKYRDADDGSARPSWLASASIEQAVSAGVVSTIGVTLLPIPLSRILELQELAWGMAFAVSATMLAVGLVYAGYWLLTTDIPTGQYPKVAVWTAVGTVAIGVALGMMIAYQLSAGAEVRDPAFFVAGTLTVGAVGGFLVGVYDARRVQAEALIQERKKTELFNQILRHNVLNAVNIIHGRSVMLRDHVDPEAERHLETVIEWSDSIAVLTRKVRTLIEEISRDDVRTKPIDVVDVLTSQLQKASGTHDGATFTVEESLPAEAHVAADEMLSDVFENVLENAVEHNDTDEPAVTVSVDESADSIVVRVADNGPGVPDPRKDEVFGRTGMSLENTGVGLGLYLVDQFVDRYGGAVWIEDHEPRGAVFAIELPRAREEGSG